MVGCQVNSPHTVAGEGDKRGQGRRCKGVLCSGGLSRSACGGEAPTSFLCAHSRPAAGPSDSALGPFGDAGGDEQWEGEGLGKCWRVSGGAFWWWAGGLFAGRNLPPDFFRGREIAWYEGKQLRCGRAGQSRRQMEGDLSPPLARPCIVAVSAGFDGGEQSE